MGATAWLAVVAISMANAGSAVAQGPDATNLRGFYRAGQVFLQWDEPEGLTRVRFRVLCSPQAITEANAAQALVLGDYIAPGSSTDWWLNPETYGTPLSEYPEDRRPQVVVDGWIIQEGGERIAPGNGLFVHTVTPQTAGPRFYAVVSWPEEGERVISAVRPGANSLVEPIAGEVAPIEPIWQADPAAKPAQGAGAGMPLDLLLHAKRGRGGMQWLVFGPGELGWRESLPFKFGAEVTDGAVRVVPTDRTWIDRMFPEGYDECERLTPAIHSFWAGYNDHIYDPALMDQGTAVMFTERRVLWIVDWVQRYFGTDPMRSYAAGGSMGGCGSFNIAFRHPEIFAAIAPNVGIVAYQLPEGPDSRKRIEAFMGGVDRMTDRGMTVAEWLDAGRFALDHEGEALPFVIMSNGRNDSSIPWGANPPFYRAMQQARQGLIAAWNEGTHGEVAGLLPDDIKQRMTFAWMRRFALDRSYPAFSNCTANDDPGNGAPDDGDLVGFINRGLDWDDPIDQPDKWEVTVRWTGDEAKLPLTVDITPRRLQHFRIKPGAELRADIYCFVCRGSIGSRVLTADENGLVTVTGAKILGSAGIKVTLTRVPAGAGAGLAPLGG
ncbi:MAG: alpha/beta hydrolase-fold protein [Armatimonadota bacterium]